MRIDIETAMNDLVTRSTFKNNLKCDYIESLLEALDLQIKDIPLNFFIEKSEVLSNNNPLHNILSRLPKEWFYDKDSLKKDIIKLLEQEDNEDRLKEIQDILNR